MNKKVKNGALYVTELDYHARYDSAESDFKLYIHTIGYSTEWMLFVLVIL